ncbi:hypothetical protein [Mesorhizobium sp. M2D.F.Ca.ET.232.01.1.1]|nr:hypothetical protein [Mesorhizobium sp. M2D.F.Ca.ET.232.01.1.1]
MRRIAGVGLNAGRPRPRLGVFMLATTTANYFRVSGATIRFSGLAKKIL